MAAIVEASGRRNPERGITGFLLSFDDVVLQYIEGPPIAVELLLSILKSDARHDDVTVLHDTNAEERWFADWGMKHLISFGSTPALEEIRVLLRDRPNGNALYDTVRKAIDTAPDRS